MTMSLYRKHSLKLTFVATATGIIIAKYIYRKLKSYHQNNKCIIIQSISDWNVHEDNILRTFKKCGVVGIDCEWVTIDNNRKPVSLLQLANSEGFCVLIRLSCIPVWLMPPGISDLLKDRNILKVGVGVNDDVSKLFHDYCLDVQGFVDLRYLTKDLKELQGKSLGLKSLAKEILNYDLDKSYSLRCSNWDAEHLTPDQIKYAADDAIIAARLFENVKSRKSYWLGFRSTFNEDVEMYMDMPFKQSNDCNNVNKNSSRQSIIKYKSRYSKPRQRPMYDNCQLVAPDGETLCSCDKRKAEWYIYKGLGETISEEPFIVRLKFEPSGRPKLDNIFYTMEKVNCCVVCGKTDNYHRKLVVPSEYRKYFPDLMKKNLSHDVLLLCVDCHKRSNILDQKMRSKLAELCNAPLVNGRNAKYNFDVELAKVRSAASALIHSGEKIPESWKKILEKVLIDYFNIDTITEDILHEAYDLDVSILNKSFIPHGLKVYQYFCENGGLIQFEKMWRQHFLDSMQPKYLPTMWSVEHNHKRLALQIVNHERDIDFDISILGFDPEFLKSLVNDQEEY